MSQKRATKLIRRRRRQGKRQRLRTVVIEKTAILFVEDGKLIEASFGVEVKEGSGRSLSIRNLRP